MHFPFTSGKKPDTKKLYNILDLSPNATTSEIRKQFKKLALNHHPDKGGDQDKFKEISLAYEVLSDPEKRKIYDQYGLEGLSDQTSGGADDIFDLFFGGGGGGRGKGRSKKVSEPRYHNISVTLEEIYTGKMKKVSDTRTKLCHHCKGEGSPLDSIKKCQDCGGQGYQIIMKQIGNLRTQMTAACPTCHRKGKINPTNSYCTHCSGHGTIREQKKHDIYIKPGALSPHTVTLEGEADESINCEAGDLIIRVEVEKHPLFTRHNADLILEQDISLLEALTGFSVTFKHLDNRIIKLSSSPNHITRPGDVYKVDDEGLPHHNRMSKHGNLFVRFNIIFPPNGSLKSSQIETIKSILPTSIARPAKKVDLSYPLVLYDKQSFDKLMESEEEKEEQPHRSQYGGGGIQCEQQ